MARIAKIITGIFAVAIIGAVVFINTLDVNQYKSDIIEAVGQATGRQLHIGGDLQFSLLFAPAIKVEDVKLSNAAWGSQPDMLRLNELELQVALLPLLNGDIQIKRLVLAEPEILLETNKNGIANWEFTGKKTESSNAATDKSGPAVTINEVQIQNAKVHYLDGLSGQKTSLHIDQILTATTGLSDELSIRVKASYNDMPLQISGNLTLGEQHYSLQAMNLQFGNTDVSGAISADMSAKRPLIKADLNARLLDLAELAGDEETFQHEQPAKERVFSSEPLPLEGLKAFDVQVAIHADEIKTRRVTLEKTRLTATLKNGLLSIKPINALLAGGQMNGIISLNADGKIASLTADISLKGLEPARIGDLKKHLSGATTDIAIKLKGSGNNVSQIMAGLNGKLLLQSGQGEIKGTGLNLVGADLLNMLNPTIEHGDKTSLTCTVINFNVKDGIATTDKGIALMTKQMDVIGSGTIDFKTEKLDIGLKPRAREGLGLNVGQLTDFVRLGGTLANPKPSTDVKSALTTGLKIQTAVATGGLSLLAQGLFDRVTADEDPCVTALNMRAKQATSAASAQSDASEQDGGITDKIKGFFR